MPRMTEKLSIWFDYPDDPDKGRVEITNLDDEDIAMITAKAYSARNVYDTESGLPRQEHSYNTLVDRQETAVRCVTNWENFFGTDGKPMKCSRANKSKWACNTAFMDFVKKCCDIVKAKAREQTEAKRKN